DLLEPLEEAALVPGALELGPVDEPVVDARLLPRAGRPGVHRHGEPQIGDLVEQAADDRSLADAGWPGDDDHHAEGEPSDARPITRSGRADAAAGCRRGRGAAGSR